MQVLTDRVGRYIFAVPFVIFGLLHFAGAADMKAMVPSFIPGGVFWVYLTGLALIAAGVSIISGKMAKLATMLLAGMLAIFVLTIHLPALIGGAQTAVPNLLKDLALCGASLTYSGIFAKEEVKEEEKVTA